jgi:hypothetical protein
MFPRINYASANVKRRRDGRESVTLKLNDIMHRNLMKLKFDQVLLRHIVGELGEQEWETITKKMKRTYD